MDHSGKNELKDSTDTETFNLVACPHPFKFAKTKRAVIEGCTISEMLASALDTVPENAHVYVDSRYIKKEEWDTFRPPAKSVVTVRAIPMGSGEDDKSTWRIVAAIAVVALSFLTYGAFSYYGISFYGTLGIGSGTAGMIAGTAVSMVGNLAINALIPPPAMDIPTASASLSSKAYELTGTNNKINKYGPIPKVFGRHRIYPPLAANPYTEIEGETQHLYMLFCAGYGPLTIDQDTFKIGDVSIGQYENAEVAVGTINSPPEIDGVSLFLDSVSENRTNLLLPSYEIGDDGVPEGMFWPHPHKTMPGHDDIPWTHFSTDDDASEVIIDFYAPMMQYWNDEAGMLQKFECFVLVQIAEAGTGAWIDIAEHHYNHVPDLNVWINNLDSANIGEVTSFKDDGNTFSDIPVLVFYNKGWSSIRFQYVKTKYDIRIKRVGITYSYWHDMAAWTQSWTANSNSDLYVYSIRTKKETTSILHPNPDIKYVALKIEANEQINGMVETFNFEAQAQHPVYDGSDWSLQETSNPAWAIADVLSGNANHRALPYDRLNGDSFLSFADFCDLKGFEFNSVLLDRTTVFKLINQIASVGLGTPGMIDGKYSIVYDVEQTTPVQMFTPRNSWGFKGSKLFGELPHALKIQYINKYAGYQADEIIVYDDDYDASNAERFETIDAFGCVDSDQAWKVGRYHLASAQLRPETYELNVDIEHLVCTRGDLIRVAHDVPLWGQSWGRIKGIEIDGAEVTLELDENIVMVPGEAYAIQIRTKTGQITAPVSSPSGEYSIISCAMTPAVSEAVDIGDLFAFGISTIITTDCIVKTIEPGPNFSARLTLVDAAPEIHNCDSGEIPDFDPNISLPVRREQVPPPRPELGLITSDEFALEVLPDGTLVSRIIIDVFCSTLGSSIMPETIQAEYRVHTELGPPGKWIRHPDVPFSNKQVIISPVRDLDQYEIRIRFLSIYGTPSEWVTQWHTVIGKTSPPPDVKTFYVRIIDDQFELSWSSVGVPDLKYYEIRYGADWDSGTEIGFFAATSVRIPAIYDSDMTFWIVAYDTTGNASNPVQIDTSFELPAIENLRTEVVDNNVLFKWTNVPGSLPIAEVEFRKGEDYDTATVIGSKKGSFTSFFEVVSGEYTYWATPIDTAGNYGSPISIIAVVDQPPDYQLRVKWDIRFDEWSAGSLETLSLVALPDGRAVGPARYWETFGGHFNETYFPNFLSYINAGATYLIEPVGPGIYGYLGGGEIHDYGAVLTSTTINLEFDFEEEYNNFDDCTEKYFRIAYCEFLGGSWTYGDYNQRKVYAQRVRYVRLVIYYSNSHDLGTPCVQKSFIVLGKYSFRLDSKVKNDSGSDQVLNAAGGVYVEFNQSFVDVISINVTPRGDTNKTAIVDFVDAPNPTGFTVYLYNSTGTRDTGAFFWDAKGY